jgi:hypothetical protein
MLGIRCEILKTRLFPRRALEQCAGIECVQERKVPYSKRNGVNADATRLIALPASLHPIFFHLVT